MYSTKQKFLSCFPQNVATWVMLTVLYQTSPLLSSWNVPSVFWSHHCNVHPNKAEREYNNNYNMYHVYMLTFKNCFRLTNLKQTEHMMWTIFSSTWYQRTEFIRIVFFHYTLQCHKLHSISLIFLHLCQSKEIFHSFLLDF